MKVVSMIRGEKGTTVRLRVIPNDAKDPSTRVVLVLVRDEIKLTEQEAKARIIDYPSEDGPVKLGVIDLPSFYADFQGGVEAKSTTRDVALLVNHLKRQGIQGLLIDLRRNGGGSLAEAVTLTQLFNGGGPVVQVREADGRTRSLGDPGPGPVYNGPMAVLTSRRSASASEIFAGAIQDYGRGVIIGHKSTFGKGTVQSVTELARYMPPFLRQAKPGALKYTIQKFYRVSGASTQHRGVVPDLKLPSVEDELDFTESSTKNALPYDEVAPAPAYAKVDRVGPYLAALRKNSEARIEASPEYAYVKEDSERAKKRKETKTVSLNEAKRLAEKEADEAREAKRKKERSARKGPDLKGVEVTLQSLTGAPAPKPAPKEEEKKDAAKGEGEDDEDEDHTPDGRDPNLEEGLNILRDLAVSAGNGMPTAGARQ
jgi:carboxyl-terminal processing protease